MQKLLRKSLLLMLCLFSLQLWAQDRQVSGTILDPDGVPLPGVNVIIKNTNSGTVTDFDGKFSLNIPESSSTVLIFSSLGFATQEINAGNQTVFDITLQSDTQALDEVVVVGYGTQKRANLTGAVSTIDAELLESRPITDVARGLQGTSPGLTITSPNGEIGENPTIRLRGAVGTLSNNGGAQPLILVDNVEVTNLQAINPQDIKDISVLKDAASTSIYGSRAAWGVVLITTKNGSRNQAPTVDYSNNFSWATPTTTPKVAPAADGAEMAFAAVNRRIPSLDAFGIVGMYVDKIGIEKMRDWERLYGNQDLGPEMVENRDFEIRDGKLFFYRPWEPEKLFVKEWALQQKHDLSVSGGSENTNYYLGLGYLNQGGVYKTNPDKYDRYNLNLSINTSITDWFKIRAKVLHTNSVKEEPFKFGSETYDAWYYTTRWPAYYPYGTFNGKPFRNHISEVSQAKLNTKEYSLSRVNLGGLINPLEGLTIDFNYTHDRTEQHEHQTGGTLYAYNFWAQGADLEYVAYSSPAYDRAQYNSSWSRRNTAKAFATYEKEFGDHALKVLVGGDFEEYDYWYHSSQRRDLLNPDQGELDLATGDQFVSGYRRNVFDDIDPFKTLGAFARINYAYKDRYLLELNGRYDGSSKLSLSKKWAFFPSFSAGYILTKEDFMENLRPTLSFLKLRGSYGSVGNQNSEFSDIYRLMNSYGSNWVIDGKEQVAVGTPGALPYLLTWEKVSTLDFGADMRFFQNQLGLNVDWYRRTVSDMHSAGVTLPNTFGTNSPKRNYGELQTTGWEVAMDFNHTFDNGMRIDATATFSDFTEKITKFANTTQTVTSNYEGKVLGEIWGYETDRFFTADDFDADGNYAQGVPSQEIFETNGWFNYGPGDVKYKDINGDGVINYGSNTVEDHGDMKVIGNSTPRYQYGFRLGANWIGFDFSFFMQGVGKRDLWANGPVFIPGFRYGEAWYKHQLDYWTPESPNAYYPRPNDQGQSNNAMNFLPQSKYLLDLSYLRMKNITFGYTIPSEFTQKIKIDKFRVYFSGENVFEFTGSKVPVDPEVDYNESGLRDTSSFGRVYPFRRSFSLGLQLTL